MKVPKKIYKMSTQLILGERAESHLDSYFIKEFDIWLAREEEQRRGIDRWFKNSEVKGGKLFSVEYKSDFKAAITGNFFIEVESVVRKERTFKDGWALTSQAEIFCFFVPQMGCVYWVDAKGLKLEASGLIGSRDYVECANVDYVSRGILITVLTIARLGRQIIIPRLEI